MHRVGIKMRKYISCENKAERNHVVEKFFEHKCPETEYVALRDLDPARGAASKTMNKARG